MKILLLITLVATLLAACNGPRAITSHPSTAFDCEILAKKQRQQFRKAIQQAKANHRRKPLTSKPNDHQIANVAEDERWRNPSSVSDEGFQDQPVYRPSSVFNYEGTSASRNIFRSQLPCQEQNPIVLYPLLPFTQAQKAGEIPEQFANDAWIWPAILFGGAMGMLMIAIFQDKAKVVSRWAKVNKLEALSILVVTKICTGVGWMILGNELYDFGVAIPDFVKIPTLGVLASAFAFYPSKYFPSGAPAFGFLERKLFDATIFTMGSIIMLYAGNHFDVTTQQVHPVQTVAYVTLAANGIGSGTDREAKISVVKKQFKQKLKTFMQEPKKEMTKTDKTILTLLLILLAVVLTFGVAALSCSLACSGAEGIAVFVGLGGIGLVVFGLARSLRAIHRRPTKKRATDMQSTA